MTRELIDFGLLLIGFGFVVLAMRTILVAYFTDQQSDRALTAKIWVYVALAVCALVIKRAA